MVIFRGRFSIKFISTIILAILLVTVPAFAHDLTYYGPLKAKETKAINVDLPAGKLTIEIFSTTGSKLDCRFVALGVAFEQNNTPKCTVNLNVASTGHIEVQVYNPENKESDYKIWVHDTK